MATVNEKMTAIADNIRDKTGGISSLTLDDIANGVNEVYEVGTQAEYNRFWNTLQDYGNRTDYTYAFAGNSWVDEIYDPKYDITVKSGTNLFRGNTNITDTKVPIRFVSKGSTYVFNNCPNLIRVPLIEVVKELEYTGWLNGDKSLVEITIEGEIGNNIGFQYSPLNTASIVSVIEHLSNDTTGKTTTFLQTAVANMAFPFTSPQSGNTYNSWDELIATKQNWTISLV